MQARICEESNAEHDHVQPLTVNVPKLNPRYPSALFGFRGENPACACYNLRNAISSPGVPRRTDGYDIPSYFGKQENVCGITGVFNLTNPSPVSAERLRLANHSLFHRGPDDEGILVETNVGLAMRRLSIIDIAHGQQPMSNEDGTVHIVYNGEIYNHRDLRHELQSLGHIFRTNADTEAVVHGYEQWGHEGLLERLRGMFAFAIWDRKADGLFLARDRMGIKPLYTATYDGRLYFGSEIRAILLCSDTPRRANFAALDAFLQIGFVTAPHTMFEGVEKLPPAHYMWVKKEGVSLHKYWELTYEVTNFKSERAIIDEFRDRFQDSVSMHLMSEAPLGALLSGGVDSTAIVTFMRQTRKDAFTTVALGFEGHGLSEADAAARSAHILGTDHHAVSFTDDTMRDYPRALYFEEDPCQAPYLALYQLFKACRALGLKVVMTGEGADELLGGYAWHQGGLAERLLSPLPFVARRALHQSAMLRSLGARGRHLLRVVRGVPTDLHVRYQRALSVGRGGATLLSEDAKSALSNGAPSVLDSWADWLPSVKGQPEFEQVLWIQSRTRMPDYINHSLDRMSMAHSIEARPPFLDHKLWEFCASIPPGLKMRASSEKYLLRKAGENLIPEEARVRRKSALRIPFWRWVAQARLPEWCEVALSEGALRKSRLFDPGAVMNLRRGVQAGDLSRSRLLMCVLSAQTWANIFLESSLTASPWGPDVDSSDSGQTL